MKNSAEKIIYVGKAKNLKKRVASYFQNGVKGAKTLHLVSHIKSFEFMIVASESEAFVLENNLIKKHSPKYNLRLKDDKSYPYIVVDSDNEFPRLLYKRRIKRERGKEIFGPFPTGSNVGEVLKRAVKAFLLRDCSLTEFKKRKEPCLLYQMKQCSAPCVGYIDQKRYREALEMAIGLFSGRGKSAIAELSRRMEEASACEEFEKAAMIRDDLTIIKEFVNNQWQKNAELKNDESFDVIAFYAGESEVDISIAMIRNGILIGNRTFNFPKSELLFELEEELLSEIFEYYESSEDTLPEKIIMNLESKSFGDALKIKVAKPTKKYQGLYDLSFKQAMENQRYRLEKADGPFVALAKIKELLSLKEIPRVIECYDVAVFQGSSPTAAQVVFHDGKPDKKNYRYYHLEARPEGNNDFAMLSEFFNRRLEHGDLPDLIVVDGGGPQVRTLKAILDEKKLDTPIVGIAKEREEGSRERLIIPGRVNPYFLDKDRALLALFTRMRDEAHRFCRKLHHSAEKRRLFS